MFSVIPHVRLKGSTCQTEEFLIKNRGSICQIEGFLIKSQGIGVLRGSTCRQSFLNTLTHQCLISSTRFFANELEHPNPDVQTTQTQLFPAPFHWLHYTNTLKRTNAQLPQVNSENQQ